MKITSANGIRQGIYRNALVRRAAQWLDKVPRPATVCEISHNYVAGAHWGRTGQFEALAIEPLPPGSLNPTAVETNMVRPAEVRDAVARVFAKLHVRGHDVALLVPDPVIRVFVLHFDVFPRSPSEAIPLLRWRLKKSVPFEAEETLISFMRQAPREEGVDIVTGLARLRIIREYEQLMESVGMSPGVVMSSTLAALPLLDDHRPALLARVAGRSLTTAIAREGILCGFRCMELPTDDAQVSPRMLLDEIYPLMAYYQDSWSEGISAVRLAGLGGRMEEFASQLETELRCPVGSLLTSASGSGQLEPGLRPLVDRDMDALVGWAANRA